MKVAIAAAILGLTLGTASASTFNVTGTVVDPNGRPVERAQVFVCDVRQGARLDHGRIIGGPAGTTLGYCGTELFRETKTRTDGSFAFVVAPPDDVVVGVQRAGFTTQTCAYRVVPDASLRIKFVLEPVDAAGWSCVPGPRPEQTLTQDSYSLR